jgi:hypothetical protein
MEGQAVADAGVRARTRQDQELGGGRPDVAARGRGLPEAPDRAAAVEGAPVLLVHWLKRHQPGSARVGDRPVWEELEVLVKEITSESFVPESLIPPQGIPPLCDDAGLRATILDWLLTLDESGVAVRQTGGRDPPPRDPDPWCTGRRFPAR